MAEGIRGVDGAPSEVQWVLEVLVDDAVNLAGLDPVRQQGGDDRAGAATHVNVEIPGAVEPLLERGDDADLVHAADDAATRESQCVAWPFRPPAPDHASQDFHRRLNCSNVVSNRVASRPPIRKPLI